MAKPTSAGLQYAHIALSLPMAVVAGWGMGAVADHFCHTKWMNLAGLLLGVVSGFVEIGRAVSALNKESQQEDRDRAAGREHSAEREPPSE